MEIEFFKKWKCTEYFYSGTGQLNRINNLFSCECHEMAINNFWLLVVNDEWCLMEKKEGQQTANRTLTQHFLVGFF